MTAPVGRRTPRSAVRALAVAIVVVASACSAKGADISGSPPPAEAPQAVVPLPHGGGAATVTAPSLPPRSSHMPPDTVPLIDLYHQGSTDVLR